MRESSPRFTSPLFKYVRHARGHRSTHSVFDFRANRTGIFRAQTKGSTRAFVLFLLAFPYGEGLDRNRDRKGCGTRYRGARCVAPTDGDSGAGATHGGTRGLSAEAQATRVP